MNKPGWGVVASLLLLLTGCSVSDGDSIVSQSDPSVQALKPGPITFNVLPVEQSSTRASGFIKDSGVDASKGDVDIKEVGFGVFASYTGMHRYSASTVKPDFMYNDHVLWSTADGAWTYSPQRFWPNGEGEADGVSGSVPHYVSFFAYAPWSDGDPTDEGDYVVNPGDPDDKSVLTTKGAADYCIPSFSLSHENGDPWLVYRIIDQANLDKQVDLLYGDGTDDGLLDRTKRAADPLDPASNRVNISFKHALALFGEKVTIRLQQKADPDDTDEEDKAKEVLMKMRDTELRITKVTIDYNLTSKARLTLWNHGQPNWEPILSQLMLEHRTVTLFDSTDGSVAPIVLFRCDSDGAQVETIPTYVDGEYRWESAADAGNAGVFFIPVEVDGFPQTAIINVTYETYFHGVKDPALSKTKSSEIFLSKYYDVFKEGGRRLNQVNVTLTLDED